MSMKEKTNSHGRIALGDSIENPVTNLKDRIRKEMMVDELDQFIVERVEDSKSSSDPSQPPTNLEKLKEEYKHPIPRLAVIATCEAILKDIDDYTALNRYGIVAHNNLLAQIKGLIKRGLK